MQNNNIQKPERHFTGFYKKEVEEAKRYSGYFYLFSVLILIGQAMAPYGLQFDNPDWFAGVAGSFVGMFVGFVLLALLISWIVRSVVKLLSSKTPNRYDYFTMTLFVLSIFVTLPLIFG